MNQIYTSIFIFLFFEFWSLESILQTCHILKNIYIYTLYKNKII